MNHLIHLIAAARPNFMKIAPLYHALRRQSWARPRIVHTGQHYDANMSDAFFEDLRLPPPDIHLEVGSGSHAEQTGRVMMAYEQVLEAERPALVVVVGDVNSTLACTLAVTKIPPAEAPHGGPRRPLVAHLEAGLRSYDRDMPEEINRVVTDVLADVLWTPSPDADENLVREGIDPRRIVRVGNIMIDSLEMLRERIEAEDTYRGIGLRHGGYAVVTLHRPSNVDRPETLARLCEVLARVSERTAIVFPVHPRTRKNLMQWGLLSRLEDNRQIILLEPVNYIRFMNLVSHCRLVITDSGGIQEETTYLGIPCLTLRPNTERPVTVTQGTNRLCSADDLEAALETVLGGGGRGGSVPELWDGRTAERVVASIEGLLAAASA